MADMNVKFDYDKDADILYITLGTGEPSYCEEVDDILLVERGLFTNNVTGFRILDISHHRIQGVGLRISKLLEEEKSPYWIPHLETLRKRFESAKVQDMLYA